MLDFEDFCIVNCFVTRCFFILELLIAPKYELLLSYINM